MTAPELTPTQQLVGRLKARLGSLYKIAARMGLPYNTVWHWANGRKNATGLYMRALEDLERELEREERDGLHPPSGGG